jgi:hypothetical protein
MSVYVNLEHLESYCFLLNVSCEVEFLCVHKDYRNNGSRQKTPGDNKGLTVISVKAKINTLVCAMVSRHYHQRFPCQVKRNLSFCKTVP